MSHLIHPVQAEVCNTLFNPVCTSNPDPITHTQNLTQLLVNWLIIGSLVLFFVQFILGGYKFISAGGDPKKLQEAKDTIGHSLLGLVVVFSIFALVRLIAYTFQLYDLQDLRITLPTL